jgi:hypothetical protein
MNGVGTMKLLIKKLTVVSAASDSAARLMSDAEFEFCCLRGGSSDGTLQGIDDLDLREECRENIKIRTDQREARQALLCSHHGSKDGTLDGIADLQERENVRQHFAADQDCRHTYYEMKLKFERARAEKRKRHEARGA